MVMSGSEKYRLKIIKEMITQANSMEKERDFSQLKVKEVLEWASSGFEWSAFYRIRRN